MTPASVFRALAVIVVVSLRLIVCSILVVSLIVSRLIGGDTCLIIRIDIGLRVGARFER